MNVAVLPFDSPVEQQIEHGMSWNIVACPLLWSTVEAMNAIIQHAHHDESMRHSVAHVSTNLQRRD